jgi:hypothetical protein
VVVLPEATTFSMAAAFHFLGSASTRSASSSGTIEADAPGAEGPGRRFEQVARRRVVQIDA